MINCKKKYEISRMFCTNCGTEGVPIPRSIGSYKEPGHLKKLYCFHCNKETNHAEIKSEFSDYTLTDFKLEWEYHNFDHEGNRIVPYRIFRGQLKKIGVI